MSELDEAFSGTKDIAEALKFDEAALAAWMDANVEGFSGPLTVTQFRGGQSNPTYKLETPDAAYVLRRKPPGKLLPSAHAVDREYKVMAALGTTGFPVPKMHGLEEDETVIGTPFYAMDFVTGRIFWDPYLPGLEPDERAAIYDASNATLAKLHGIDYEAIGLGDYGKPGDYFVRQIGRWTKQYKAAETQPIEAMDKLIEWLPENAPEQDRTAIVHGDYRLDNMIFHPEKPEVVAVLDWELSTLGDPLADELAHLGRREPVGFLLNRILQAGGRQQGVARVVVDDLDVNVLVGAEYRKARALLGSPNLAANTALDAPASL